MIEIDILESNEKSEKSRAQKGMKNKKKRRKEAYIIDGSNIWKQVELHDIAKLL